MRPSLLTKFLIFLILLAYSTNTFTFANPKATITDELIYKICSETRSPSLCLHNLKSLKGNSLLPSSVAALGTSPMRLALSHGNSTAAIIWARYRAIAKPGTEPRLWLRYYTCFVKYTDVMKYLKEAKKFMVSGDAKSVKICTSMAVTRVNSCGDELVKPPSDEARPFLEANSKLKDICSIIEAICNNVQNLK